jgi:signal transduction histidine kinase
VVSEPPDDVVQNYAALQFDKLLSEASAAFIREESQNVLRVVPMAEVTASLSHELNQPLGAILNNAQAARRLLNAKPLDVEDLKDAVEGIIRDVGRATDIVRHTREAFHPVIEGKDSIDLRELLLDVERVLRNDAKARGISLRLGRPTFSAARHRQPPGTDPGLDESRPQRVRLDRGQFARRA